MALPRPWKFQCIKTISPYPFLPKSVKKFPLIAFNREIEWPPLSAANRRRGAFRSVPLLFVLSVTNGQDLHQFDGRVDGKFGPFEIHQVPGDNGLSPFFWLGEKKYSDLQSNGIAKDTNDDKFLMSAGA